MLRTLVQNVVPGDTGGRVVRTDLNLFPSYIFAGKLRYGWVNYRENYSISAPPVRRIGPGRARQC